MVGCRRLNRMLHGEAPLLLLLAMATPGVFYAAPAVGMDPLSLLRSASARLSKANPQHAVHCELLSVEEHLAVSC